MSAVLKTNRKAVLIMFQEGSHIFAGDFSPPPPPPAFFSGRPALLHLALQRMSTGTWFSRFFEFEEDDPCGGSKFDRAHAHLNVTATRNGSFVMTVKGSGKTFWVGR